MKTQIIIATQDDDYANHLSANLAEHHSDIIDVSVCSTTHGIQEQLAAHKHDIALLEANMIDGIDLQSIQLPILLWSEETVVPSKAEDIAKLRKYTRISKIVSSMLELYARTSSNYSGEPGAKKANITAVWSPA